MSINLDLRISLDLDNLPFGAFERFGTMANVLASKME
jgi:hypothetical protein